MKVGPTIRRLREARGLTQAELARRAQLGRITLIRIEGGLQDPTLNSLEQIARALGMRVRDLLPTEGGRR